MVDVNYLLGSCGECDYLSLSLFYRALHKVVINSLPHQAMHAMH